MKTFLVVNPRSANGQTGARWAEIQAQVATALGTFEHAFTEKAMDAQRIASRAIDKGFELVVAVGGDGTVNEVTNGFFANGQAINSKAALGVIARGTGCDFPRTFGWKADLASAIERLKGDGTQPIDVGRARFVANDGNPSERYFINVASIGVSGLITDQVNRTSKALGAKVSFVLGTVKGLLKYTDRKVRVSFDGGPTEELSVTALAVANGRYFGGGMFVAPGADTADGLFDVTIWSGFGVSDFALKIGMIYDGTHVKLPGTRQLKCRTLRAESAEEVLLEVDGEQPGRLGCEVSMLPSAIRLKV